MFEMRLKSPGFSNRIQSMQCFVWSSYGLTWDLRISMAHVWACMGFQYVIKYIFIYVINFSVFQYLDVFAEAVIAHYSKEVYGLYVARRIFRNAVAQIY